MLVSTTSEKNFGQFLTNVFTGFQTFLCSAFRRWEWLLFIVSFTFFFLNVEWVQAWKQSVALTFFPASKERTASRCPRPVRQRCPLTSSPSPPTTSDEDLKPRLTGDKCQSQLFTAAAVAIARLPGKLNYSPSDVSWRWFHRLLSDRGKISWLLVCFLDIDWTWSCWNVGDVVSTVRWTCRTERRQAGRTAESVFPYVTETLQNKIMNQIKELVQVSSEHQDSRV